MHIYGKILRMVLLVGLTSPITVLATGNIAHADQYPTNLKPSRIASQTMTGGGGETYPAFANDGRNIVSETRLADQGGETYPSFANPTNGGRHSDYAAIGMAAGVANYASLTGFNRDGG